MREKNFFFIVAFTLLLCYTPCQAMAQTTQARIDSMLAEVPVAKDDTSKVLLLCEISRAYFQLAPDKGIVYGNHALKLANQLNYDPGAMKANNAIGRCYAVQHDMSKAVEHFTDALSIARKLGSQQDIGNGHASIGNVYSDKGEYKTALSHFSQADKAYEQAGMRNRYFVANGIGVIYLEMKDYRSALNSFKDALRMEKADKSQPGRLATLYLNIGGAYSGLNRDDSSLPYLFKALENAEAIGNKRTYMNALNNLSAAYLNIGDKPTGVLADSLTDKKSNFIRAIKYGKQAVDGSDELDMPATKVNALHNISYAYYLLGDLSQAYKFLDLYTAAKDSLSTIDMEVAFAKTEAEFKARQTTDSLKHENLLKEQVLKKRRSDRNKVIAIITLIGISGLLIINRQKLKHIQKRKEAEAQKHHAEELASQQLHDFTRHMQEKNDLIEAISAEIAALKKDNSGSSMSVNENLLSELRQSILLTDVQWDNFKANFEKVHAGYLSRLRTKLPDLTPAETRFVVLSKLKLSSREMASMLGITPPAVRANKYRLMKKLGFEEDSQLDELIQSV